MCLFIVARFWRVLARAFAPALELIRLSPFCVSLVGDPRRRMCPAHFVLTLGSSIGAAALLAFAACGTKVVSSSRPEVRNRAEMIARAQLVPRT
jgi:hypothetical protein